MRSELISEIFSVESEAERLVSEAREQARSIILKEQQAGEHLLQEATSRARAERELAIEEAQAASSARIEQAKALLDRSDDGDNDLHERAECIAEEMVKILCATRLGDTRV